MVLSKIMFYLLQGGCVYKFLLICRQNTYHLFRGSGSNIHVPCVWHLEQELLNCVYLDLPM